MYAMFATFATPNGHTGCDSYETAEKSNRFFFLLSLVGCPGKVTMSFCYYMQWVINVYIYICTYIHTHTHAHAHTYTQKHNPWFASHLFHVIQRCLVRWDISNETMYSPSPGKTLVERPRHFSDMWPLTYIVSWCPNRNYVIKKPLLCVNFILFV